jgi:hypothetical protein
MAFYFEHAVVALILGLLFFGQQQPCAFPPPRPSIFSDCSFWSTALLTGMTGISLHMQWHLTSQLHGSVPLREQLVFCYGSNSTPILGLLWSKVKILH